ncbi:LuxR C-terminal-related transcriptional regulator [Pseudomonas sp. LS44]|uniref:LuxR C-terminal-related transcriptional regulator n=1 Tax=Pseudomonas sp. LS44 TaxID=1357074 RepID=UPI00215ADF4A|nr:LuxR C-terminal-related transcriptional regulator [Pseudomonas sp. LS44]UVE16004.1 LuxR C-terminal-related transcriptional regulator [Pseudomonas sp. LS44]
MPACPSLTPGTAFAAATPPPLPSLHQSRPHLIDELGAKPYRLRLLYAPAGYGKSVLFNEYLRHLAPTPRCLWLSLRGQAPSLDWLCAQLTILLPGPSEPAALLERLRLPGEPLVLVLDDLGASSNDALNVWIDQLLSLPETPLQLWVSCRQRSPWRLAQLMLDDQLLELGAERLSFSRREYDDLVPLFDPAPGSEAAESAWQQTQGWCAGARLLLGTANGADWLRQYLGDELLSRVSAEERQLLIGLAHLPRVSAEFCDQLWELQDGGTVFRRLLRDHPVFQPVDSSATWYRLLPPVARALQGELGASELSRLRLHACRYLSGAGFLDEAIELALSAGQVEVAVSYMHQLTLDWLFSEQHLRTWLDWRSRLPLELLESTPLLIYLNARALLMTWRLDEAATCLERLNRAMPQVTARRHCRVLSNWQALHGTLRGLLGDVATAREHCSSAPDHLDLRDWQSAVLCHSTLARVEMAAGQPDQARQRLQNAVELSRRQGCLASEVLIDTDRIRGLLLSHELSLAEALLDEDFALVAASGRQHALLLGRLWILRGELLLLRGNLDTAETALVNGVKYAELSADPCVLHGSLGLAEVAACRGQHERGHRHLLEAERRMQRANVHADCYQAVIAQFQLRILARQGLWQQVLPLAASLEEQAHTAAGRLPPLHAPSMHQRNRYLLALAEFGTGRAAAAESRLRRLADECERMQFRGLLAEVRVALFRVELTLGRTPARNAEDGAILPPFSLVAGWDESLGTSGSTVSHAKELTAREFGVLELLAEGLSNQEISERLFISLNTVKAHTVSINHKLGVRRRTQAVMRARSFGMLS